jgi:hypothetical protein
VTRIAIVAITLGILTTATAIGSASAAEMPKELRDIWWCADRPGWSPRTHSPWPAGNYRRCRLPFTDAEDAFEIGASGWTHDMTDETCEVLRVTSYGKGHFIVRARCNNGEESNVLHRWRLLNSGRRLEIRDATIEASAADAWQEDFRRCRVLKQFSQGEVVISAAGEKMVELDVHWSDEDDLDKVGAEDISVRIDNAPVPHPKPLRSTVGLLYGFELGSFNAIFPALSRGKRLQISFPDKPERTVDLDIGAGGKAVAFLKKCDRYWINWRPNTRR